MRKVLAMTEDQKSSCKSEFGAEILMVITSLVILIIILCQVIQLAIRLIIRIRKRNAIISGQNASLFLSSVYALFLPVMSYMFSQAKQYNQEGRAELLLIWMVLIETIRVGDRNYSTWELQKSLKKLVRLFWVGFLVYSYTPLIGIRVSLFILCIYSAFFVVWEGIMFYLSKESYLIGKNPILINNHVKQIMLQDDLQTTPMQCCDYIVMDEENHEIGVGSNGYFLRNKKPNTVGILTIGRIFHLYSPEVDQSFTSAFPNWRDDCLSLALAKMLRRRFDKVPVDEAGCKKALDFVLEGLIGCIGRNLDIQTNRNDGERNPIERVFSIIQGELKLVSDFFLIKVLSHHYYVLGLLISGLIRIIFISGIGLYLIYATSKGSVAWISLAAQEAYNHCFIRGSVVEIFHSLDKVITTLLILGCFYIQYTGILTLFTSTPWFSLIIVKIFIKDPADWNRFYSSSSRQSMEWKLVHRISNLDVLPKTHRKNVKEAGVYSSVLDAEAETIFCCIKVDTSILARLPKWIRRNIPRSSPTLVHSTDAKEAILSSFKNSGGRLSNGETSLKKYRMGHLNWACQPNGSTTEAILIWHIATTLLFHNQKPSPQQNNVPHQESTSQQKKEREVALALSNYCHYLVMYFPELLPDDVDWTEEMYVTVRKEILAIPQLFGCKRTTKERCDYALQARRNESSVVGKGAMLSKELMKCVKHGSQVWTMLAEFWAEMMLFIAPSDNVDGHEKILDQEELITQLWALLTHAGILTRPKPTEHRNHESKSNVGTGNV